ncbi:MAG: hypothetical protein KJO80_07335 [Gammaproteobacteria bacterium]|nr:hypothetical protein [Gammaproteobacteria bacterium]NNK32323.1 hypothetical protein [Xanthomonadales bacterium]
MKIKDFEKANDFKTQLFDIQLWWVALVIAMSLLGFFYGFLFATEGFEFAPDGMSVSAVFLISIPVVLLVGGSWLLVKRMTRLFTRLSEPSFPVVEKATP